MANCGKDILLPREGTEQKNRFNRALDPVSVKLNDFGLEEWMKFAYDFAAHLNYFNTENDTTPNGNWQEFFKTKEELAAFLKEVDEGGKVSPHLALFVSFVQLIELSKRRFNKLTQRHLDFYYSRVLNLQKQAAKPDNVHILFELAKNATSEIIEKDTALDAGKDSDGKKLVYKTSEELIANQTKVAALKSLYNDHENSKIKAADIANSYDGKGADFPNDDVKWWPFAYYELPPSPGEDDVREYAELNDAKTGFALAGEIFELQEGERDVVISLDFEQNLSRKYSLEDLRSNFEIFCTGEKDWLGPFDIVEKSESSKQTFSTGSDDSDLSKLNIVFRIPKDEKAIVAYNTKTHGERFDSTFPVCRVLLKTENTEAHDLYRDLIENSLSELSVNVNVRGIEHAILSNDIGSINADKPFYPFGTQPVKKSKFYIDYPELKKKKWSQQNIDIEWKNTPVNFKSWYYAYRSNQNVLFSQLGYIQGIYVSNKENITGAAITTKRKTSDPISELRENVEMSAEAFNWQINKLADNFIVDGDDHFTAAVEINEKEEWSVMSQLSRKTLFEGPEDDIFHLSLDVTNPGEEKQKVGPVRLSLNDTFLHEMYSRLYALAMSSDDNSVIVPNEPYTPFIEKLTLSYSASASIKPDKNSYSVKDIDLYHEHPFGQALECVEEKSANKVVLKQEAKKLYALPTYCKGGELYIGLENALPKQNVSLLIQVLEGSENPEAESFVGKQKVEWWMLCNNAWKQLDRSAIISNQTDNLLKSGILKFTVPAEATRDNTLLPAGYMWLKARIHKKYNAVSKMLGIHAQAVLAGFENNGNGLEHLQDGLAAETISKMLSRPAKVKSLLQPYSSFGGAPQENDTAFYRRVSERLRHKNRAITLWDYEHLVLQNFPEIHKVKCLNHTSTIVKNGKRKTSYLSPGNVVLVVIPDIVNRNVFDIYKPRVGKATLNRIQEFLQKLNSPLVTATVINPEYEEVRVDLKVQFHSGFDEVYYKTVLKKDLTRLLSPWAFDTSSAIRFGLSLHKSVVVDYVEKLAYVDFVSDVKLFQKNTINGTESNVNVAVPSSPEAILVSAKTHTVNDHENKCSNSKTEPAESCQP